MLQLLQSQKKFHQLLIKDKLLIFKTLKNKSIDKILISSHDLNNLENTQINKLRMNHSFKKFPFYQINHKICQTIKETRNSISR